jgi:hypothetical protein
MEKLSALQIAIKWSVARPITCHAVQVLCKERILGATKWQGRWMIPADAVDPRGPRGWVKGKLRGKNKTL